MLSLRFFFAVAECLLHEAKLSIRDGSFAVAFDKLDRCVYLLRTCLRSEYVCVVFVPFVPHLSTNCAYALVQKHRTGGPGRASFFDGRPKRSIRVLICSSHVTRFLNHDWRVYLLRACLRSECVVWFLLPLFIVSGISGRTPVKTHYNILKPLSGYFFRLRWCRVTNNADWCLNSCSFPFTSFQSWSDFEWGDGTSKKCVFGIPLN